MIFLIHKNKGEKRKAIVDNYIFDYRQHAYEFYSNLTKVVKKYTNLKYFEVSRKLRISKRFENEEMIITKETIK